ncbi:sulfurtransferase [Actinomycetospora termitidis]|uniref:Rhodanese-like domain-containing protein n=1 Tax=Actinomycetospora termitidis TaxID=3053470 RepID=A0ABT7M7C0_9PSEU|nr:rhodanese-like domain-containing protein [Actinomycetospora sp. Odt1-22]MDL5156453.1 rhodanese-like domain-containing protein [Actinomycetospora sp. Odt1-22]
MPNPQGPLVSAADLVAELAGGPAGVDGRPVVLDVRWRLTPPPKKRTRRRPDPVGEPDFDAGHVPGAVFVDVDSELAGPPGPAGRHPLPDPDDLQTTMRRAGIGRTGSVVVYDGVGAGDGMAAARAWWVLRWAGLAPEQVRVLDGGYGAWTAAGGESSTASGGVRTQGDVDVAGGGMPVLTADSAASVAARGTLLDARAAERFRGETEPIDPVAGHIPGAANVPVAGLLTDDGRWRSATELAGLLEPVVGTVAGAYCGSGVSAAMLVLAAEIAGVRPPEDPVGLYVGSWSNWVAGKRPVETGTSR